MQPAISTPYLQSMSSVLCRTTDPSLNAQYLQKLRLLREAVRRSTAVDPLVPVPASSLAPAAVLVRHAADRGSPPPTSRRIFDDPLSPPPRPLPPNVVGDALCIPNSQPHPSPPAHLPPPEAGGRGGNPIAVAHTTLAELAQPSPPQSPAPSGFHLKRRAPRAAAAATTAADRDRRRFCLRAIQRLDNTLHRLRQQPWTSSLRRPAYAEYDSVRAIQRLTEERAQLLRELRGKGTGKPTVASNSKAYVVQRDHSAAAAPPAQEAVTTPRLYPSTTRPLDSVSREGIALSPAVNLLTVEAASWHHSPTALHSLPRRRRSVSPVTSVGAATDTSERESAVHGRTASISTPCHRTSFLTQTKATTSTCTAAQHTTAPAHQRTTSAGHLDPERMATRYLAARTRTRQAAEAVLHPATERRGTQLQPQPQRCRSPRPGNAQGHHSSGWCSTSTRRSGRSFEGGEGSRSPYERRRGSMQEHPHVTSLHRATGASDRRDVDEDEEDVSFVRDRSNHHSGVRQTLSAPRYSPRSGWASAPNGVRDMDDSYSEADSGGGATAQHSVTTRLVAAPPPATSLREVMCTLAAPMRVGSNGNAAASGGRVDEAMARKSTTCDTLRDLMALVTP